MYRKRPPAGIAALQQSAACAATQAFTYDGVRLRSY
jgi:hypothetical protein